jgi:hypothetical protein
MTDLVHSTYFRYFRNKGTALKKTIFPYLFIALLLSGCINDLNLDPDTSFNYQGTLQAPLIHTRLNLGNLVDEDSLVSADPDGLVRIVFRQDTVVAQSADEYISLPNQNQEETTFIVGNAAITIKSSLDMLGDTKLKSAQIGNGLLNWHTEMADSTITDSVILGLTLLDATINGSPAAFDVKATGLGQTSGSIDVSGLLMDFTQGSPAYNNIGFEITMKNAGSAPVGTAIDIILEYNGLQFSEAQGYFGQRQINLPGGSFNTDLSILNNLSDGLFLANPQINLITTSTIGVPVLINVDMIGIGRNGSAVDLNLDSLLFAGPAMPGEVYTDTFYVTTANSNIDNFIAAIPEQINYSGYVKTNPNGETSTDNFVSTAGETVLGMEIELPLELSTTNLTIEETIFDLDFGVEDGDIDFVEELTLGFRVVNGFPLDADVYFYFQDSTGTVLDSNSIKLFDAAQIDATGNVITPATGDRYLEFNRDQIRNILRSDQIRFRIVLNTPNGGSQIVRLLTSYYVDLIVGARVKLNYNLVE